MLCSIECNNTMLINEHCLELSRMGLNLKVFEIGDNDAEEEFAVIKSKKCFLFVRYFLLRLMLCLKIAKSWKRL
jgi:hypothetical protein